MRTRPRSVHACSEPTASSYGSTFFSNQEWLTSFSLDSKSILDFTQKRMVTYYKCNSTRANFATIFVLAVIIHFIWYSKWPFLPFFVPTIRRFALPALQCTSMIPVYASSIVCMVSIPWQSVSIQILDPQRLLTSFSDFLKKQLTRLDDTKFFEEQFQNFATNWKREWRWAVVRGTSNFDLWLQDNIITSLLTLPTASW